MRWLVFLYVVMLVVNIKPLSAQLVDNTAIETPVFLDDDSNNPQQDNTSTQQVVPSEQATSNNQNLIIPQTAQENFAEPVVFAPEFMASLSKCKPDSTVEDNGYEVKIIGLKNNICHLEYANFTIQAPLSILSNIHGFDDLRVLLKNKEFSHYNYKPQYNYNGIIYAYGACLDKKDYYEDEKVMSNDEVIITTSLSAETIDQECIISLGNQLDVDGVITDYGVTCRLNAKVMAELRPYFEELLNKYGAKRVFGPDGHIKVVPAQNNKETNDADIALMYYMQQKGYCRKNNQ